MATLKAASSGPILTRMAISGLFGQYDYAIPADGALTDAAILYGDNGSGKTTLLNLAFHMLSPADNRGHRTAIAYVPFRHFEMELTDGTTLSATREADKLVGGYRLDLRRPSGEAARWDYQPGPRPTERLEQLELQRLHGTIAVARVRHRRRSGELAYLLLLKELDIGVYLLSADRQLSSDSFEPGREEPDIRELLPPSQLRNARNVLQRTREFALNQALRTAWQWISRQAVVGTNVGSDNTNSIYTEIVRRISRSKRAGIDTKDLRSQKQKIEATLLQIAQRSTDFARYEFLVPLKVEDMIDGLQNATGKTAQVAMSVLQPYIEGAQARFAALQQIFALTETFVSTLNGFYGSKSLTFGLTSGFKIQNSAGLFLEPQHLSSGEQQLLLLFCHTLIARDRPGLFIIDEPELSLNVKWQRKLLRALLDVAAESRVQFLLASHSIELLSQHKDKVVPLRAE
jgi:energy-coupling factor transporter ATP-binding protein EcfA2